MLIFGGTVNVVPWVWGPEILPLEARTRGVAISVSSHWIWNFMIVLITPVLITNIHWATYIIFTCTLAAFVPIVYFAYPETSNLSLEEVDNLFLPEEHQIRGGSVSFHPDLEQRRRASWGSVSKPRAESPEKVRTEQSEKV